MNNEILDDFRREHPRIVLAGKGKRLTNYIIDYFVIMGVFIGILSIAPSLGIEIDLEPDPNTSISLPLNLLNITITVFYYILAEGGNGGVTIGKMVTRTRAVRQNGDPMDMNDVLLRSICRIVPFEPLSFLGSLPLGWHDKWTKTIVIDESLSEGGFSGR